LNYPLSPESNARRPLIIERVIDKGEVLLPYLFNFSQLSYRSCTHSTRRDDEFLARVIEADMIEFKNIDHFDNAPKRILDEEVKSKERPCSSSTNETPGEEDVVDEDFVVVVDNATATTSVSAPVLAPAIATTPSSALSIVSSPDLR
jgi:hypothetical protein